MDVSFISETAVYALSCNEYSIIIQWFIDIDVPLKVISKNLIQFYLYRIKSFHKLSHDCFHIEQI